MRYPCQSTNRFLLLYCLLGYLLPVICGCAQGLQIDEIMLNNRAVLADEHGDYPDWIGIFNHGLQPVALEGWSLTDDPNEPEKHLLNGQLTLNPGERRVIWLHDDFSSSEV